MLVQYCIRLFENNNSFEFKGATKLMYKSIQLTLFLFCYYYFIIIIE